MNDHSHGPRCGWIFWLVVLLLIGDCSGWWSIASWIDAIG